MAGKLAGAYAGARFVGVDKWTAAAYGSALNARGAAEIIIASIARLLPVSPVYDGQRLTTHHHGERVFIPLFVILVLVEATDLVFAIDSAPAILAISHDPSVVFSSNAMAILGLRALCFLLEAAHTRLVHLNRGLGVILRYGVKMIIARWHHINALASLGVITIVLMVTIVSSLRATATVSDRAGAAR